MALAKPVIKFKTYRQAAAVGGKIYGVPDLGDPVVADVTMQEVIDYAKLHNYSADTLSALLSQVIAGVADLVARDGRPRNLSDLLKFEPVIKGTFDNLEQTVSDQKVLVRPRMLKEIKVALDPSDYSWQNVNDRLSPRFISAAPVSDTYSVADLASFTASITSPYFGWSFAGDRLAPNGNSDFTRGKIKFAIILRPTGLVVPVDYHYEKPENSTLGDFHGEFGLFTHTASDEATDNVFVLSPTTPELGLCWYIHNGEPLVPDHYPVPRSGDTLIFQFKRTTSSGDTFTVEKSYTL